jgi:hypothetical protein
MSGRDGIPRPSVFQSTPGVVSEIDHALVYLGAAHWLRSGSAPRLQMLRNHNLRLTVAMARRDNWNQVPGDHPQAE